MPFTTDEYNDFNNTPIYSTSFKCFLNMVSAGCLTFGVSLLYVVANSDQDSNVVKTMIGSLGSACCLGGLGIWSAQFQSCRAISDGFFNRLCCEKTSTDPGNGP